METQRKEHFIEWERIDDRHETFRIPVPQGWLVNHRTYIDVMNPDGGSRPIISESLAFVHDPEHSWDPTTLQARIACNS